MKAFSLAHTQKHLSARANALTLGWTGTQFFKKKLKYYSLDRFLFLTRILSLPDVFFSEYVLFYIILKCRLVKVSGTQARPTLVIF